MRLRFPIGVWGAGLLMVGSVVHAAFTGRSEAGFVMSRGNADTETANARFKVMHEGDRWRQSYDLGGLRGRTAEATIASRWDSRLQVDRRFGGGGWSAGQTGSYWFGALQYEDDRFSGFDYQATVSTGAGHEFINTPETKLKGQLGVGYRRLRTELLTFDPDGILTDRVKGDEDSDAVANGALSFEHAFNKSTKLINALSFEAGEKNTLSRNDLALQVKMNAQLAISLGLSVRNNSSPPPLLANTDTLTTVNLVYERKVE